MWPGAMARPLFGLAMRVYRMGMFAANPHPAFGRPLPRERGLALALPTSFPVQHPQAEYRLRVAHMGGRE